MRSILYALALTSMAGAASATPSMVHRTTPPTMVQQADWYCGPHCQRHHYYQQQRWEHERWRESHWRYNHRYPYYGYNNYYR